MADSTGPTELVAPAPDFRNSRYVDVKKDRLRVTYIGDSRSPSDVATVTANRPVPKHTVAFYFEATCLNSGLEQKLTIGFVPETWKRGRQAGWDDNSYGYHGKDGKKYHHSLQGEDFGPSFAAGDVVGAGIILAKREIFFTKNGTMLPAPAFKNVHLAVDLYPAISLQRQMDDLWVSQSEVTSGDMDSTSVRDSNQKRAWFTIDSNGSKRQACLTWPRYALPHGGVWTECSKDESMEVNFGQKPFVFDIQVVIQDERASLRNDIAKVSISPDVLHGVVRNYLIYHAHVDTLAVFDRSAGSLFKDKGGDDKQRHDKDATHAPLRKALRQHVVAFRSSEALELVAAHFPTAFSEAAGKAAALHLHCQAFVELVHSGDVMAALEYGRAHLAPFQRDESLSPEHQKLLGDTIAIIAYPDLTSSPVSYLVEPAQRSLTASIVNATILQHLASRAAAQQQTHDATERHAGEGASTSTAAVAASGQVGPFPGPSLAANARDDTAPMDVDAPSETPPGAATSAEVSVMMRFVARLASDMEESGKGAAGSQASRAPRASLQRPRLPTSLLESIMQQLQVVTGTLHEVNGQQGEPFDLQKELQSTTFRAC